jgi:rhodanese-related sulfurtransferase
MEKEKINVKRLSITLGLILLTAALTAGLAWYFMDQANQEQNKTIESLKASVSRLMEYQDIKDESSEETSYQDVTPEDAKKLIEENEDLVVLDVSPNYDKGHLPGAINYYLGDGSLDKALEDGKLDKEATYLVYCHVDSVAIAGAEKLIDAGFKKVYRLEGNYAAWVDAGYEIER